MRWPFVLRAVHDVQVEALEREIADLRASKAYWRARAELFIDRSAAKAGLTHEPVMRHAGVADVPVDPFALNPFGGMGIQEIDTSRSDGRAGN